MSITCPRSGLWLRNTLQAWTSTQFRSVSTGSAINRGLRATRDAGHEKRSWKEKVTEKKDKKVYERRRVEDRAFGNGRFSRNESFSKDRSARSEPERSGRQERPFWDKSTRTASTPSPSPRSRAGSESFSKSRDRNTESEKLTRTPKPPWEYRGRTPPTPSLPKRHKIRTHEVSNNLEPGSREAPRDNNHPTAVIKHVRLLLLDLRQAEGQGRNLKKDEKLVRDLQAQLDHMNELLASGQWSISVVRREAGYVLGPPSPEGLWDRSEGQLGDKSMLLFRKEERRMELLWAGEQSGDRSAVSRNKEFDTKADPKKSAERKASSKPQRREEPDNNDQEDDIPLPIPYTTASTTFLYGTNTVLAALKTRRRKLYTLYTSRRLRKKDPEDASLLALVAKANEPHASDPTTHTKLTLHEGTSGKLLDRMADNRPHNGIVLETSPLPTPPVLGLGLPNHNTREIPLNLGSQSAEDIATHGAHTTIPLPTSSSRQPLIVMLDGILDPQNVGSILRTCHFYGVAAVAVSTNTCAPLSSATLAKASSGACEAIPILALPRPGEFVYRARNAGWKVYAAVAPDDQYQRQNEKEGEPDIPPTIRRGDPRPERKMASLLDTAALAASAPLAKEPCLLMLGAEGEGLRQNLRNRADFFVTIKGGQRGGKEVEGDVGVDSVNVGVAAGVLVESFVRGGLRDAGRAEEA